jgi:uncharacterized protein YlbG (UPF0298 family)
MVSKLKMRRYIRLLFWNANGVQSKMNELQELLQLKEFNMCAINELHLLPKVAFNLCNFVTHRQDRVDPRGLARLSW